MDISKKQTLAQAYKRTKGRKGTKSRKPLWDGPESNTPNGGVTQSMIGSFLVCRERFRLRCMEGLRPVPTFNSRIEFGSMWHICMDASASRPKRSWKKALLEYCKTLGGEYPLAQEEIVKWYNVCLVLYGVYLEEEKAFPKGWRALPAFSERVFCVPYELPSGRVVYLRGKWDGVVELGERRLLLENKTKGQVVESQLRSQLRFDLQTMLYLEALHSEGAPVDGVMYNVVRRPLSGGKGSIRQHKPSKSNPQGETKEHFYQRLEGIIRDNADEFFFSWIVQVSMRDRLRFREQFLQPFLEELCDWYRAQVCGSNEGHYRTPYGIYNVLAEGGSTDLDEYLENGSQLGLQYTDTLFGELR